MADIYYFTDDETDHSKDESSGGGGEGPAGAVEDMGGPTCPGGGGSDEEDEEEEEEEGGGGGGGTAGEDGPCSGFDDDLVSATPLARLIKCAHSDNYFDRQMVARSIQETLRAVVGVSEDVHAVLEIMASLSSNEEAAVRTELMEQVPQIAVLCHEYPTSLGGVVAGNLVPMVVRYLTDPNNQVRKTSQAALLVLLEQELVGREEVHNQVCPVILSLTSTDALDEFKTEAVALMSKMAPLIGRDMTERLFLQRFTALCSDALFQVRKVCASNFGDFCSVVGSRPTEEILVSRFVSLCEDGVWGVRKACAEVFMSVSCACSLATRKDRLSPVFVSLLTDQSRWVRVAAFQNLGPFISTFADPSVTGLHYNEEGVLVIGTPQDPAAPHHELNADTVVVSSRVEGGGEAEDGEKEKDGERNAPHSESQEQVYRSSQYQNLENTEWREVEPMEVEEEEEEEEEEERVQDVEHHREHEISEVDGDRSREDPSIHLHSAEERRALAYLLSNASNANTLSTTDNLRGTPHSLPEHSSQYSAFTPTLPLRRNSSNSRTFRTRTLRPVHTLIHHSHRLSSVHTEAIKVASQGTTTTTQEPDNTPVPLIPPNTLPASFDGNQTQANNLLTVSGSEGHLHVHLDSNPAFNTFNYWRIPIPLVELPIPKIEVDINVTGQTTNVCVKAKVQENNDTYQNQVNLTMATDAVTNITMASSSQDMPPLQPQHNTIEADLEALAASLQGVMTEDDEEGEKDSEQRQHTDEEQHSEAVQVSATQPATYAQVCAASVSSVQHKGEAQPSILASRLTQARVNMSGGSVTEIKKREVDVVSPSDCVVPRPSLPSQPGLLSQRIVDPFTMMLPHGEKTQGQDHQPHTMEFVNLSQDIVPKTLLEHYISMTDPVRAETVDTELTRHCAYSLPAVALTLGRQNWPVLKDTYETLAGDMHWKVRRTLAFSIHELAVILGEEIAQSDLVPVFNGFIKDLDEVRIGVLKHLAHFLRLLRPQNRRDYLPRMDEFLRTDNENNWRFRLELATQLSDIIDLFSPQDCQTFIAPIALSLMADKVVHIRRTCYSVVCQLVKQLNCDGDPKYVEALSKQLKEKFAQAPTWSQRQSYAFLCGQMVAENSLHISDWVHYFLPSLLGLATDRVPNVRIAVAKMLTTHVACLDFCQNPENEVTLQVQEVLEMLRQDKDRDVGHFACCPMNTDCLMDPHDPTL
ncbi:LOW QUALITY PROTEIN: serine/threonine-protein phosphatase 4 regulatory subunit 1-like [Portunus trituberculatus]|uniref:LOW QUALITY PROTEIN: serine/threonine-protein phosphatase 4 regulatory subunit 1-like n=1 Tax=Portunus trituberculatus TaxID=210409 RepID=UPI001E1D0EA1|nr:LOW QUALITY PROTEIN: serine/threonine-protein phosphatase 4 regulatory subunit 1-like [Portunus trituberculatus]